MGGTPADATLLARSVGMELMSDKPRRGPFRSSWVAWALLLVGVSGVAILSLRRPAVIPQRLSQTRPSPVRPGAEFPPVQESDQITEPTPSAEPLPNRELASRFPGSVPQRVESTRVFRERMATESVGHDAQWIPGFPLFLVDVEPVITTAHRFVWVLPDQSLVIYDRDADRHREIRELSADEVAMMDQLDRLHSLEQLDSLHGLGQARSLHSR